MATIMKVRRQGGAHIVTLPGALLERIGAGIGTSLALSVRNGAIVAKPVTEPASSVPPRYTLEELLEGAENLPTIYRGVRSALEGGRVGDEIGRG